MLSDDIDSASLSSSGWDFQIVEMLTVSFGFKIRDLRMTKNALLRGFEQLRGSVFQSRPLYHKINYEIQLLCYLA